MAALYWMFTFIAFLNQPIKGLEVCDVLEAVDSLEENVMSTLKNINRTLTKTNKCNSAGADSCNADAIAQGEWKLAFRGTANTGQSVYYAYKDGLEIPTNVPIGCKQIGNSLPCSSHYRNDFILNNWNGISEVALVVYKNNVKVHYVIFDGAGSNYMNWLDKSRVKASSWSDMKGSDTNFFSIAGHQEGSLRRSFFMNRSYGGCANDAGWFVVIDNTNGGCAWEQSSAFPAFRYSTSGAAINWNDGKIASADYFAILVRYFISP